MSSSHESTDGCPSGAANPSASSAAASSAGSAPADPPASPPASPPAARPRPVYRRPVGPRLKILLAVIFGMFAVLGVNSVYLVSVTISGVENLFYMWMFLAHLVLGLAIVVPVIVFGIIHIRNTRNRPNRRAIQAGYALFIAAILLFISGFLLTRVDVFGMRLSVDHPVVRGAAYWMHVITPVAAVWLFVLHRLAGRRIKWRIGVAWAGVAASVAAIGVLVHRIDPTAGRAGPESEQYFFPSLARTSTGDFIPANVLDNNGYCLECHAEVHDSWMHSVHKWSSFNNPAYAFSVRETREKLFHRDGDTNASRFCAGCHDPVPFFSGAFDDPKWHNPEYDVAADPLGSAGISCTVCHSISHVNSPRGNADYTITEPVHYPFTFSENGFLRWVNRQLVKAKPDFHRTTFLKPLHQETEFCGTCHKVHLPEELNQYKWLRGQNHHDSFWLSGVSGHSVSSFYYPPQAEANCNGCHMKREPALEGENFAAKLMPAEDGEPRRMYLDHQFPSANTAIPYLVRTLLPNADDAIEAHRAFTEQSLRIDFFGLRDGDRIDDPLIAPLRPDAPTLEPGESYLVETVLRTLTLGHLFTEGTADSNQIWVEFEVLDAGVPIAISGGMDDEGFVDRGAHFVNAFVLDRNGDRIDRRNAEDIFVPLYNHQIPPGAADTLRYRLNVPADAAGPITLRARLRYRKFDTPYLRLFAEDATRVNDLPIIDICRDEIVLGLAGQAPPIPVPPSAIPEWQRWNDYGIGLLRRGDLRPARTAFERVEALGRPDGPINLVRTYLAEGLIQTDAPAALGRAAAFTPAAREWHLLWFGGQVAMRNGDYLTAAENFEDILAGGFTQAEGRNFDFSRDYRLRNALGQARYQLALAESGDRRRELMISARDEHRAALEMDPENLAAHWGLKQIARDLGDAQVEAFHAAEHAKYKPDDNARDVAVGRARSQYPEANRAAEDVVIYELRPPGEIARRARTVAEASAADRPSAASSASTEPGPASPAIPAVRDSE